MRRARPFVAAGVAGQALGVVPGVGARPLELLLACALTAAVAVSALLVPWDRVVRPARVLPPLGYVVAVALMRDAAGGAGSGLGALLLLPVLWVALYGRRGELVAVLGAVAAAFYAPMAIVGGPAYPLSGWRTGALFVLVGALAGFTSHGLIARLRTLSAEREHLLERFRALAVTDPLTGLANRRAWDDGLVRTLAAAYGAGGTPLCVAVLDLDHFKRLNDTHGHARGDRVLAAAAAAWQAELRPRDVLARIGGEEFALLLECPLADALRVVERVRAATPGDVTCSAGVAEWYGEESAPDLLARADALLYRAKAAGRDRAVSGAPDLRLVSDAG